MWLDDLWFADESIRQMEVAGNRLELRVRWKWEYLPLLLIAPPFLRLRWDHIDDPGAGIPVHLLGWQWRRAEGRNQELVLHLVRPPLLEPRKRPKTA